MRRREFIALLRVEVTRSGILLALLVAPITGGWGAAAPKRIGILATTSCPGPNNPPTPFFSCRFGGLCWVEGKNFTKNCILAYCHFGQAPPPAADLVWRRPDGRG